MYSFYNNWESRYTYSYNLQVQPVPMIPARAHKPNNGDCIKIVNSYSTVRRSQTAVKTLKICHRRYPYLPT